MLCVQNYPSLRDKLSTILFVLHHELNRDSKLANLLAQVRHIFDGDGVVLQVQLHLDVLVVE